MFAFMPTAAAAGAITYWSDITGQERTDLQFRMDSAKCELIKQQVSQVEEIRSENLSNQCKNQNDSACINSISSSIASITGNTEASKAYKTCMTSFGWERYRAPNYGYGDINFLDGSKYQGNFRNGKYDGQGVYTFTNGNKYVGEFKNGKSNGQGTLTYADGGKYTGNWKNGKSNGQGTLTYADGSEYTGNWKDDVPNGQGTYTYADGSVYNSNLAKRKRGLFGFRFTFENGALILTDIIPGSPAQSAKIPINSEIYKINGIDVKSITRADVEKLFAENDKILIDIKNIGRFELTRSKY